MKRRIIMNTLIALVSIFGYMNCASHETLRGVGRLREVHVGGLTFEFPGDLDITEEELKNCQNDLPFSHNDKDYEKFSLLRDYVGGAKLSITSQALDDCIRLVPFSVESIEMPDYMNGLLIFTNPSVRLNLYKIDSLTPDEFAKVLLTDKSWYKRGFHSTIEKVLFDETEKSVSPRIFQTHINPGEYPEFLLNSGFRDRISINEGSIIIHINISSINYGNITILPYDETGKITALCLSYRKPRLTGGREEARFVDINQKDIFLFLPRDSFESMKSEAIKWAEAQDAEDRIATEDIKPHIGRRHDSVLRRPRSLTRSQSEPSLRLQRFPIDSIERFAADARAGGYSKSDFDRHQEDKKDRHKMGEYSDGDK